MMENKSKQEMENNI